MIIKVHAEETGIEISHVRIEFIFQTPTKFNKKMYLCQKMFMEKIDRETFAGTFLILL